MSRVTYIEAKDSEGQPARITVQFEVVENRPLSGRRSERFGTAEFFTEDGVDLNYEGGGKFESVISEEAFYVTNREDQAWLDDNF